MISRRIAVLVLAVAAMAGSAVAATPPHLVNYQGVLRGEGDEAVDGTVEMRFTFFSAESGGDEIATDVHTVSEGNPVRVTKGLFNVHLNERMLIDGPGPDSYIWLSEVFAEYDREPSSGALERVDEVAGTLRESVDGMTLAATTAMLREANDLWAPAARLSEGLAAARGAASLVLGRAVLLTGSGPTLMAVYPSEAAATRAAVALQTETLRELEGAEIMTTSTIGRGEQP